MRELVVCVPTRQFSVFSTAENKISEKLIQGVTVHHYGNLKKKKEK